LKIKSLICRYLFLKKKLIEEQEQHKAISAIIEQITIRGVVKSIELCDCEKAADSLRSITLSLLRSAVEKTSGVGIPEAGELSWLNQSGALDIQPTE